MYAQFAHEDVCLSPLVIQTNELPGNAHYK